MSAKIHKKIWQKAKGKIDMTLSQGRSSLAARRRRITILLSIVFSVFSSLWTALGSCMTYAEGAVRIYISNSLKSSVTLEYHTRVLLPFLKWTKMYYGNQRFWSKALTLLRKFVHFVFTCWCAIFYRPQKGKLPAIDDELLLEPVIVLAAKIRARKIKCEDVVKVYVKRMKAVQPYINSLVDERFLLALKEAQHVDEYILSSGKTEEELEREKPLLGIPFSCKSCICLEGMTWEAGQVARKGLKAERDAKVVRLMREAGAIPLAMTNVPEICLSVDTYNKLHGQTRNPYDLTRSAGGSSGGESALISAAGSVFGIGNDLCGSLRIPACFTGIYAHKPTAGIISNDGIYPEIVKGINENFVQGPMCRYADDLSPLMKVMAGDNQSLLRLNTKVEFRNLKIYYTEDELGDPTVMPVNKEIRWAIRKAVHYFKKNYDVMVKKISMPKLRHTYFVGGCDLRDAYTLDPCDVIGKAGGYKVDLLTEIPKSLLGLSNHTLAVLWFAGLCKFLPTNKNVVDKYKNLQHELRTDFDEMLQENCVFFYPTTPVTAINPVEILHNTSLICYTMLFNTINLPVTQCPLGLSGNGMPMGMQIVGGRFHDHLTIAVGRELERVFGGWQSPCKTLVKPVMQ